MSADRPFSTPTQTSTKAGGDPENAEEPAFRQNPAGRNLRNDHMMMRDTNGDEIDGICSRGSCGTSGVEGMSCDAWEAVSKYH
jgi:hypothetical protein